MDKMPFQNKCLTAMALLMMAVTGLFASCKSAGQLSPEEYNLEKPYEVELGKALNEISGICYIREDSSLLAVSDSKEKIFQIGMKSKKLKDYTEKIIPGNSDVEDIVKVDTSLFLLMSKGILIEVPRNVADTANIKYYDLGLAGTNDFETVYYDASGGGQLVLLCKTCAREKGTGVRTAYRFDLRTRSFDAGAFYTISRGQIKTLLKNSDAKFEPSAAAIHPVSKRLFILSSAGKLLVIADTRGQVIAAYDLNPDLFPQAEGIAFAPNGDMFITNEGKYGKPTLLKFSYLQYGKKK